jgi:hypothetical protein
MTLYTEQQLLTIAHAVAEEITSNVMDKTAIEKICSEHAKPPFISVLQSAIEPLLDNPIVRGIHVKCVSIDKYITENPKPINWTPTSPVCCGVLEKFAHIKWMELPVSKKLIPYMAARDGSYIQVDHCPSCGAYVRDCVVDVSKLKS